MRSTQIMSFRKIGFILLLAGLSSVSVVLAGADEGREDHTSMKGMPHAGDADADGDDAGKGMSGMHHGKITVPEQFAGKRNPYWADLDAIIEGNGIFLEYCALCHGKKGRGDGILSSTLDPKPADFSNSEHLGMMNDDYLFWRVSEGGALTPFESAMPAFATILTEDQIWKVLSYEHAISHAILLDHKVGESMQQLVPESDH